MTAQAVADHLRSLDKGWVNWDNTVDNFKIGDPKQTVTGIAVGWKAQFWALKRAHELGCNLFVCHEPLWYDHRDTPTQEGFQFEGVQAKRRWIEEHKIAVLRCHDVWDQVPSIGIPDSWAEVLGFRSPLPDSKGYYRAYEVSGRTATDVARQVARNVKTLGQEAVQLLGDPQAPVTRVVIGTGAITPIYHFVRQFGADLAICTDDGFNWCCHGGFALDIGVPVIVVNHCTAEEHGMASLAKHVREIFPQVPVHHIQQGALYRLIT